MLWCARRVRRIALLSSGTIAFFILLFGAGLYMLFTTILYEGEEALEGDPGLILLIIAPLILAIVGGIVTAVLAKNVARLSRQPGAPPGASGARIVLWLSALLWFLLFIVFIGSLTVTSSDGDGDFPVGLLTILPVYMGFCLAVFTCGAAMAASSKERRLETLLVVGLGWASFIVFLILPALLSSWNIGSGNEDINWESVIFWLRFGNLFPAILPWLVVFALNWVHAKSIDELEALAEPTSPPATGPPSMSEEDGRCAACGGALTVHPRTQEIFCTACGAGLSSDVVVVEAEPSDYEFVEQDRPLRPSTEPAPTHRQAPAVATPAPAVHAPEPERPVPKFCTLCGGELATLSKAHRMYCTACGAGLPGSGAEPVPTIVDPAPYQSPPPREDQPPPPTNAVPRAQTAPPAMATPIAQVPPQAYPAPQVQPGPPGPASSRPPAPAAGPLGNCRVCGARLAVHPRTQQTFCPACGAGLS